jgi:hypothetical protein
VRRTGRAGDRRRARAFVVFALLIILLVGSLYAVVTGLNTATASMKLSRDGANAAALKEAKEGLIAWAATRAADGPGHLPCPDRKQITNGLAGYQESTCVGAPARIGRLPFRTLGLPDLRDASGERLWYALSPDFRDSASTALPVNSDTQGSLTVEGMSAATGVVAIIFAPGTVVGNQVRDPAASNNAANYLEARNPYVPDAFLAWSGCEASACALPFNGGVAVNTPYNDQFIVVTHEELFRVVEAVVQRRIEQEIVPQLTKPVPGATAPSDCLAAEAVTPGSYAFPAGYVPGYFELWGSDQFGKCEWLRGFFPFAAPYNDPVASPVTDPSRVQGQFIGRHLQIAGLLPVSTAATWSAAVTTTNPAGSLTAASCGTTICSFTYTCDAVCGSLPVTATVRLRNAAGSLVLPTGIVTTGNWATSVLVPSIPLNPGLTAFTKPSFDVATGDLVLSLQFTLPQAVSPGIPVDITPPTPTYSTVTSAANWFTANGWYRQTYYAVSDGFRLRSNLGTRPIKASDVGYAPCQTESDPPSMPPDACVRVRNGPAQARAVLVLAGRHRAGGTRSYTIADYFELQNADVPSTPVAPANQLFERGARTSDFNDRVVIVAPEPVP